MITEIIALSIKSFINLLETLSTEITNPNWFILSFLGILIIFRIYKELIVLKMLSKDKNIIKFRMTWNGSIELNKKVPEKVKKKKNEISKK